MSSISCIIRMVMNIMRVQYVFTKLYPFEIYLKSNYIVWMSEETENEMQTQQKSIRYERVSYNKLLWTGTVCCNIRKSTFEIFVLLSFWEEKWWNEWRIEKPKRTNERIPRALRDNIKLSKSRQKIIAFTDATTITSLVVH